MSHQSGNSLIEILISFLLLSTLLFGTSMLQWQGLYAAKQAFYVSVAMQQLQQLVNHMPMLTDELIGRWSKENNQFLPAAKSEVSGYYPNYKASICWQRNLQQYCCQYMEGKYICARR